MWTASSHPHFWAKCSAVLALLFYSTMAVDSQVEYRPEFIVSVFIFSILPFLCFYYGVKYKSEPGLRLYAAIQGISALCNVIGIISIYLSIANEQRAGDGYLANCTVTGEVVPDCKERSFLSILYSILYLLMTYINIKSITALQAPELQAIVPDSKVVIEIINVDV